MKRYFTLLLTCTALSAGAQDDLTTAEELDIRRYSVEVIIFSYAEDFAGGTEIFVPDELPVVSLPGEFMELAPLARRSRELEIVMMTDDEFTLDEQYGRLRRLQAYTPLMHFGWTQATYPDEAPQTRALSSYATPPPGLQGDLTLYLSRYLHLAVDLQLDAKPGAAASKLVAANGDREDFYRQRDTAPAVGPTRYRIEEDRIFRNGELRYFDHPKFGVLVKVARVEEEEPDEEELFNTELLGE
ncbi:MAG: peptidoglycan binding protein CsiV [Gammaproteobacteria bacterium]|nr:peptidoglycan binding protein CsiV [Gammaproteobacteria bacterium]